MVLYAKPDATANRRHRHDMNQMIFGIPLLFVLATISLAADLTPDEQMHNTFESIKTVGDGRSLIPKNGRVILIKDLGAVGDGKTDDGPAFAKAMTMVAESKGNVRLLLEPRKIYRILPSDPITSRNHVNKKQQTFALHFDGVDNVIIDGMGSELVLSWPVKFIQVTKSKKVWIGNLTMTYDPFPASQTRIVAKHPQWKAIDVQLEKGYVLPDFDPPGETANHGRWAFSWGIQPNCHFWTKHIKEIDPESNNQGVFRIFPQDQAVNSIGGLKVGQRMLVPTLRDGSRISGAHSVIQGSKEVILFNIHAHAANQFSYVVTGNQGLVMFKKCSIRPRTPEGATEPCVFAGWRDGIHTKQNRGPIVFDDCHFSGLYDDDINISHITLALEKIITPRKYRIRVLIGEGFPDILPGDSIEAWNHDTGKYCGIARVVKVEPGDSPGAPDGSKYWNRIITTDQPLQNLEGGENDSNLARDHKPRKVLLTVRGYQNWAIVRNCTFDGTVRFRSPGIYEGNTFKRWMWVTEPSYKIIEGPLPQHQLFRNNTFGPASGEAGIIRYHPLVRADLAPEKVDIMCRNITYINNTIHR